MKTLLKRIYDALPFKQALFSVLRMLPLPPGIYQHLHFRGIIRVRVPDHGSFVMHHHGYMIENELFWRGIKGFEKISFELWKRLCPHANTILDIGANTGVYALIAKTANPSATVIAAEPVDRIFAKLEENIALNGGGILALKAAVTDHEGEVILYDIPAREHMNAVSLERDHLAELAGVRPVKVPARTVSGIASAHGLKRIDLLKIDVETHEPEVLAGFAEILVRDRPTLLIEILNDRVAERIELLVGALGYVYYNIDDVTWPPERVTKLSASKHFNFLLCQPRVAQAIGISA